MAARRGHGAPGPGTKPREQPFIGLASLRVGAAGRVACRPCSGRGSPPQVPMYTRYTVPGILLAIVIVAGIAIAWAERYPELQAVPPSASSFTRTAIEHG